MAHRGVLARGTTNGSGLVADATAAQIRRLRTDDGQRVPFLRQALTFVRDRPEISVVLDLKHLTERSMSRTVAIIADLGVSPQVSVISFYRPLITDFRVAGPLTDAWIAQMREADVPVTLGARHEVADPTSGGEVVPVRRGPRSGWSG